MDYEARLVVFKARFTACPQLGAIGPDQNQEEP